MPSSDKLTDRLRGNYAMGPHMPNGDPEFGWKQFQASPICHEAAQYIERLENLVQCLIENDPDDAIADGGHVVLGLWRHDAKRALQSGQQWTKPRTSSPCGEA